MNVNELKEIALLILRFLIPMILGGGLGLYVGAIINRIRRK
jgi:hypothetical protein